MYCVCAVASGRMHMKWRQLSLRDRQFVWRMYGNFTLLMLCGCCLGVFVWLCYMQSIALFFIANDAFTKKTPGFTEFELFRMFAVAGRWGAAFRVLYPLELLCISVAKLLALDRVLRLAPPDADVMKNRLEGAVRVVIVAVVLGNVVGICGGTAAAVLQSQASDDDMLAAAAILVNDTAASFHFETAALEHTELADIAASVQAFSEVAVLLLILLSFVAAAAVFFWYARSALQDLKLAVAGDPLAIARVDEFSGMRSGTESRRLAAAAGSRGWRLWRQVLFSVSFLFATFLLRATASTAFAVARALQNVGDSKCGTHLCDPEYCNRYAIFVAWNFYTPEFQLIIVIISVPLTLLVTLWGLTEQHMLQLMAASKTEPSISLKLLHST